MNRLFRQTQSQSARNVMYLGVFQVLSLLIPLITIPWVLRALTPSGYGQYALAVAIGSYAIIVVNFGFRFTGAQRVAEIRDNREQLTHYFWTVQSARFLLAAFAAAGAMLIVASVPKLQPITATVAVYLPVLIGTFLSPEWLFLGLERMRAFAVTNVISSAVCIAPIFLFVHSPDDVKIATFITASNTTMAGTICCLLIAKWKLVGRFIRPTRSDITEVCKDAWPLFVTQIAVTMYSASNTVMLGLVRTSYQVGIFSAAEKIKTNACAPINPFVTVAFPKISRLLERDRAKAVNIVGKLLIVLCAVMGAVSLTIFVAAPVIVRLIMGNDFDDAIPVLRILAIMPLAVAITSVFGPVCMINLGLKKELSRIVVMCGIVNIALLLTLGTLYGAVGAAVSITVTETLVATCYGFMLARQGFLRELGAELADKLRWPRAV